MKRLLLPPAIVLAGFWFFIWLFRTSQGDPLPEKAPATVQEMLEAAKNFKFEIGTYGGVLNDWVDEDMKTFNYLMANDAQTSSVFGNNIVFETLFTSDAVTLEIQPQLAAELPTHSEDAEGLVWLLKLRNDVVWHDGAPFTADDVVFTWNEIMMNETVPYPGRAALYVPVKDESGKVVPKANKVEKVDEFTLRFTLPRRHALYLTRMNITVYPKHVLKPRIDDGSFTSTWNVGTPPAQVIGTGPFIPSEYVPGERFILKRNPNYWMKDEAGNRLPYLDRIVFNIIAGPEKQKERFLLGELDYFEVNPLSFAEIWRKRIEKGYDVIRMGPRPGWGYIAFNQNPRSRPDGKPYVKPWKSKWFRDIRFRRAFVHAMDKDSIIQVSYDGFASPIWAPYTPRFPKYYTDKVRKYPYDLDASRKLLDEMDLKDRDGDGIREDSEGHPVEIILTLTTGQPEYERMVPIIQQDMRRVGVRLIPEFVQFNLLLNKISADWDFDAVMMGNNTNAEPLLSGKILVNPGDARRVWNPKSPPGSAENRDWELRLPQIFDEAYTSWDEKERRFRSERDVELAHEWQMLCAENLPHIYTLVRDQVYAFSHRVKNRRSTPNSLYDIERLYTDK
ncbi:MAG: ABC transporter substrate-binding protein [Planctomycetota bacterium]